MKRLEFTSEQLAEKLDRTQWANEFSWEQIKGIAIYIQAYEAKMGTVIFNEGDTDQSMGILIKGAVDIIKSDHEQMDKVIATLRPPQTFGEMSLIDGEPRSAKAIAAGDVIILMINKESFFEMSKSTPSLALKLIWKIAGMISRRLRMTSGQLIEYI